MTTSLRIALVGNLANVAYQTCKFLRAKGVEADVYIGASELAHQTSNPNNLEPEIMSDPPEWIKIVPERRLGLVSRVIRFLGGPSFSYVSNRKLLMTMREYDIIESFACQPLFVRNVGRPYISYATGSDLRELALEDSALGKHVRGIFRHASHVYFNPDRGHVEAVKKLQLVNASPYHQIIDTNFFAPTSRHENKSKLTIFHPTALDWTEDRILSRWMKGNDRLFLAFAKFVEEGNEARLIYLERGRDVQPTRELVKKLGIEENVQSLKGDLTAEQLREFYNRADIVADQFDIGIGLIALEAMSCARPVVVNAGESMQLYDPPPPVADCCTELQIYNRLKLLRDAEYRQQLGNAAREYATQYHDGMRIADSLIAKCNEILRTGPS